MGWIWVAARVIAALAMVWAGVLLFCAIGKVCSRRQVPAGNRRNWPAGRLGDVEAELSEREDNAG